MAGELLIFDAPSSNVDGTNPGAELSIGPGTNYALRAFDAPAPSQTVQYAGSVDTEGSLPASRKHENRLLSVTVLCSTAAALRTLQDKIGKIAREGGTLKWVLPNAETVIFDLHAADTFAPAITKMLYVRAGAFCEVEISLPAKPYGRGPEVTTLSDHAETTLPVLIFTETGIKGDVPALGRLVVDNDDPSVNQRYAVWGIQSRYYSAASTAKLFYEAEAATSAYNATSTAGPSGASGAGGNTLKDPSLSDSAYRLQFDIEGTHQGIFRVFARVQTAGTGVVSARVSILDSLSYIVTNDSVDVFGVGAWYLLDLGQVRAPVPTKGNPSATLRFEAISTVAGDDIYWDWVMLVPVEECSGEVTANTTSGLDRVITATGSLEVSSRGAVFNDPAVGSGNVWGRIPVAGDYLLLPPAGAEARSLRVIVKASRGLLGASEADAATDDISAKLFYTPRYLVVPTP